MVFVCIFCKRKCDRTSGLSLFRFPVSSQAKMKVWLESLNVPESFKVLTSTRICSDNFETKNFFCGTERTKLGRDAVPKLRYVSSQQKSDACSDVETVYSVPSASSLSGNLNTCLVADFELHVQMNSEDLPLALSSGDYMDGSESVHCFTSTAHEGERVTEATEGSLVEAGLPPTQARGGSSSTVRSESTRTPLHVRKRLYPANCVPNAHDTSETTRRKLSVVYRAYIKARHKIDLRRKKSSRLEKKVSKLQNALRELQKSTMHHLTD